MADTDNAMSMQDPLSVCILTSQYFGWGKIGGFASMSRTLAEALAQSGHTVSVIVPRLSGQNACERIGDVEILSFRPLDCREASRLIRQSDAQLFHSQDPTFLTLLAQRIRPDAVHVVTCRDPRDTRDWLIESRDATWDRRLKIPLNWLLEGSPLIRSAVRHATGVYTPAYCLQEKVRQMCRPRSRVGFLPNLVVLPDTIPEKPQVPTLTFIGRLDRRKHPEVFLNLARKLPNLHFVIVGKAESAARERELRTRFSDVPNIEWTGYINRFKEPQRFNDVLSRTWILVNTASREGLPLTFIEAAAFGCAIVSGVNTDNFAGRFGRHVTDGDFAAAIRSFLIDKDEVFRAGERARCYVRDIYGHNTALAIHICEYRKLLYTRQNQA